VRLQVQQGGHDLNGGHTVDQGVVHLGVHRGPAAHQALDEVHLPEWTAPVERALMQAGELLAELLVVAGRGQRDLPYVELQVEVGILDPVRVVEPERHLGEPPAELLDPVEAASYE
jgi:hypothetical protein